MEPMLLRLFQMQVLDQCRLLLTSTTQINASLQAPDQALFWGSCQTFLAAAANISKAMWGAGGKRTEARRALRESLGVPDDSILCDVVMRNNFEHFDERLERWWKESSQHNYLDKHIGPELAVGFSQRDMFRVFDPATNTLVFWGQRYDLQKIVDEVTRVLPTVEREATKPHWEA